MDLEGKLNELSQTKTNNVYISLICGILKKKKQMNKHNKTETDSQIQRIN